LKTEKFDPLRVKYLRLEKSKLQGEKVGKGDNGSQSGKNVTM